MGPNGQRYSKFFSEKSDSLFGQHYFTGQADQIDITLKDWEKLPCGERLVR